MPQCPAVVEEFETMLVQKTSEVREPTPHEVIDFVTCIKLLKKVIDG